MNLTWSVVWLKVDIWLSITQEYIGGKESNSDEMVPDSRVSGPNGKVKNFLMKAFRIVLVA